MKKGVNFFGSSETSDGIGRAAALNIECLRASKLSVDEFVLSRPVALQSGKDTVIDDALIRSLRYNVNIFHFSARWVPHYFSKLSAGVMEGFYNIGYWVCETPKIPDQWARQFEFFDEIWTASVFCQSAIARSANIPVVRIPHCIKPNEVTERVSARILGNNPGVFNFLAIFNTYSDAERKNILFTIRAFLEAHGNQTTIRLIVKVSNLGYDSVLAGKLRNISLTYKNIEIIDGYIADQAIRDLYEQADAYVSLHRAEGFGLTIADAMSLGIPVIATGYSGNMEFCNAIDTNLVSYEICPVGHDRLRYRREDVWAEPNMTHAIQTFREMVLDYPSKLRMALRARQRIDKEFSLQQISDLMLERILLIQSNFSFSNDLDGRRLDSDVGVFNTYGF